TPRAPSNPLLPGNLSFGGAQARVEGGSPDFRWVRDRMRVLSATSPAAALREYREMAAAIHSGRQTPPGEEYGMALALMRSGHASEAVGRLDALMAEHPGELWLELAHAEATALSGRADAADRLYDALLAG